MVHALEKASRLVGPDGTLVLIQPHQHLRPFVSITDGRRRHPVAALVNSEFKPRIDAAVRAIDTVTRDGTLARVGILHPRFRVRLETLAELDRYIHIGENPPRFPAGGRQRLQALWKSSAAGARIEVTEYMTVIAFRVGESARRGSRRPAGRRAARTPR